MRIVPLGTLNSAPALASPTPASGPSDVFTWTPPDPASLESRGPAVEKTPPPVVQPPTSLMLESEVSPPEQTPLDPLRQTAWQHPDLLVARFAHTLLSRSESPVIRRQDAYGAVEGCREAMLKPELADEALARLPAALGNHPPRQELVWAVASQAREQKPAALALLHQWKNQGHLEFSAQVLEGKFQVNGRRLEPAPPVDDRDELRDEIIREGEGLGPQPRPPEVLETLVARCAARASERDIQALGLLIADGVSGEGPARSIAGEHFESVSTAVSRFLGRGEKFQDSEVPFQLLEILVMAYPEKCDATWAREHLAPALQTLDGSMGGLFAAARPDTTSAMVSLALEDRPSTLAGWRFTAAEQLLKDPDYVPSRQQAHWMSQFLIPRSRPDRLDDAAESLAVRWMLQFRRFDPEGFDALLLPDASGQMKPLPEAYLERLKARPAAQLGEHFQNPDTLNRLLALPDEEVSRYQQEVVARGLFKPDLALIVASGSADRRSELAPSIKAQLATVHPEEESASIRNFMQRLRQAWLRSPDEGTPESLLQRHRGAVAYNPSEWMRSMRPSLQAGAGADLPGVRATLRAQKPGGLPELSDQELIAFGQAVALAEKEPRHVSELVLAASPFLGWLADRARDSFQVIAFGSALLALQRCMGGPEYAWVKHCPNLREGLAVLQECHKLTRRGGTALGVEQAWLNERKTSGPEWAAALGEHFHAQGKLTERMTELYERFPDFEQHGPLAARVAHLAEGNWEKTLSGLTTVLQWMNEGKSEEQALHQWAKREAVSSGHLGVDLGGLKPSVGGVLLRRKKS